MPLFGRHHNNPATTNTGTTAEPNVLQRGVHNDGTTTAGHHGHTGPGPAVGTAAGAAAGHHEGHTATGAVLGGAAGHHHAKNHPAPHEGTVPAGVGQSQNAPGMTTNVNGTAIPASGAATTGMNHGGSTAGAGEKAFAGKLEHAAGTVLCSSTLKAKGIAKEQEAQALKVQAAEIGAAERLEGEASARRERAVAHGAHPHHMGGGAGHLGGGTGGATAPTGGGGYAGGPTNANHVGGTGAGGAGGLGPQGGAGY